jgi:hypothetical protein
MTWQLQSGVLVSKGRPLNFTITGGQVHDSQVVEEMLNTIRLVEGVERVGCTDLALAPATVSGVDDEGRAGQSIPDLAASASAFHGGPPTNGGSNTRSCHSVRPVETDSGSSPPSPPRSPHVNDVFRSAFVVPAVAQTRNFVKASLT